MKLPFLTSSKRKEIEESDHGRRYGWTAEKNGHPIADLDYIRWDSDSQFWHEYRITLKDPDFTILTEDGDAWLNESITLRNKKFSDILISEFLATPRGADLIALRHVAIPEDRF